MSKKITNHIEEQEVWDEQYGDIVLGYNKFQTIAFEITSGFIGFVPRPEAELKAELNYLETQRLLRDQDQYRRLTAKEKQQVSQEVEDRYKILYEEIMEAQEATHHE